MFGRQKKVFDLPLDEIRVMICKVKAIDRAQAVIEFEPDGTIRAANKNFLDLMGYRSEDVVGRHHKMFVDADTAASRDYADLWERLRKGDFVSDKFKRVARDGRIVQILGSYNPLFTTDGKVYRVVKFATDITAAEEDRAARQKETEERARTHAEVSSAMAGALRHLAGGNLLHRIEERFGAEFEPLRADYNGAVEEMAQTLSNVAGNAAAITAGAGEISAGAEDLSRRTEQQAASLAETAAALDEITTTVKKAAEGASHARDVVSIAKADAEKSGDTVGRAVQAMSAIESSSQQISQIIGVIDEIAFQTNLLALNAGVEAARAGDSGRGFAVVASEVRALAQRSAEAAKDIKGLISASSVHVGQGVGLVGDAGKALDRIAAQVAEINTVVSEIAASAQEQAVALQEVNTAINQMDQVTQQNAAMVEQSTAASVTLSREANDLSRLIGRFQVEAVPANVPSITRKVPAKSVRSVAPARPALRTVGRGGAAPKPQAKASEENWEEF